MLELDAWSLGVALFVDAWPTALNTWRERSGGHLLDDDHRSERDDR
jgi:hypothetical protein